MGQYTQLTQEQRYQIYAFMKANFIYPVSLVLMLAMLQSCSDSQAVADYPIAPVDFTKVRLQEGVNILEGEELTLIPYYAWANREVGKMNVWFNQKQ